MKKLYLLCMIMLLPLIASANDGDNIPNKLVIQQVNGQVSEYPLEGTILSIYPSENSLKLVVNGKDISLPLSDVERISYDFDSEYQPENLKEELPIEIFTSQGHKLFSGVAEPNIVLATLPNGVYLVKAKGKTFKFSKR